MSSRLPLGSGLRTCYNRCSSRLGGGCVSVAHFVVPFLAIASVCAAFQLATAPLAAFTTGFYARTFLGVLFLAAILGGGALLVTRTAAARPAAAGDGVATARLDAEEVARRTALAERAARELLEEEERAAAPEQHARQRKR
jgi:hypothetical protein